MSSPKVRADYEELKQVVSTFKRAGDATGRSLHAVRREKDGLQDGDWIGQGATAFYKEMDDSVLPTLKRLTSALDSPANTTNQIIGVMLQAEEDAIALDSMSEMGETESLRLQMSMDRLSKMMSTLSNLLKKISDTSATLTQNLK